MSSTTTSNTPPFHRLLTFYSSRNPISPNTIRLYDSLTGNLSLGLDFPFALAIALGRHLTLRNTPSWTSLDIHVPSCTWKTTPLDGVNVDEKRGYTCSELMRLVRREKGVMAALDAMGVWALAADVKTGLVSGEDVVGFQRGELLGRVAERRRVGREQVLPLWRGGPISVAGHSWAVGRAFGVEVYRVDGKRD